MGQETAREAKSKARREPIDDLFNKCKAILEDRQTEYGNAFESFNRIASLWSAYLNYRVTAKDVAMLMVLMKISREKGSYKQDNYVDAINYLGLAYNMEMYKDFRFLYDSMVMTTHETDRRIHIRGNSGDS